MPLSQYTVPWLCFFIRNLFAFVVLSFFSEVIHFTANNFSNIGKYTMKFKNGIFQPNTFFNNNLYLRWDAWKRGIQQNILQFVQACALLFSSYHFAKSKHFCLLFYLSVSMFLCRQIGLLITFSRLP